MALTLVDVKKVNAPQPAVFHEKDAIRYIGTNRTYFRELVSAGAIPFYTHLGKNGRIYFREDLDAYLSGLKKRTMPVRENPQMSLKGA